MQKCKKNDCTLILHHCNSENKVVELAEHLKTKYNCQTFIIKADFTKQKQVEKMIKEIISNVRGVDVLVNNAANVIDADLEERTWDIFEQTLKINLIAPFLLSKHIGLIMKEKGYGKIINIINKWN